MSTEPAFALMTPDSVAADADAVEMTRIWWSRGQPVMAIKPAFTDPKQYGEVLAVAARHMAHGYAVRHGHDERAAYNRILEGMAEVVKADNIKTVTESSGAARP